MISGRKFIEEFEAGEDLSGHQFKAVAIDGTIANNNGEAAGILQNKPKSGERASVAMFGLVKAYAGAAISAGAQVKVTTSGWLIAVTSGSNIVGCGKNRNVAVASGDLFAFHANFINAGQI